MWSLGNEAHAAREAKPEPVAVQHEPAKAPEPEKIAEALPQKPAEPPKPAGPPRKGWWQRTFS
jgi:ribonuclease E